MRRITGPKMKNESGDMGHRRGPDAGRSALGPFEEGPKAGEMALEATKGRSARARFSQGGREEGWTLAGKCLAGGPMYEHRMDDGSPKAWKSTDAESRHLRSEATQGVLGGSPPMHEMPLSQNGSRDGCRFVIPLGFEKYFSLSYLTLFYECSHQYNIIDLYRLTNKGTSNL